MSEERPKDQPGIGYVEAHEREEPASRYLRPPLFRTREMAHAPRGPGPRSRLALLVAGGFFLLAIGVGAGAVLASHGHSGGDKTSTSTARTAVALAELHRMDAANGTSYFQGMTTDHLTKLTSDYCHRLDQGYTLYQIYSIAKREAGQEEADKALALGVFAVRLSCPGYQSQVDEVNNMDRSLN